MAKGQQRSTREAKKPKAEKPKPAATSTSASGSGRRNKSAFLKRGVHWKLRSVNAATADFRLPGLGGEPIPGEVCLFRGRCGDCKLLGGKCSFGNR